MDVIAIRVQMDVIAIRVLSLVRLVINGILLVKLAIPRGLFNSIIFTLVLLIFLINPYLYFDWRQSESLFEVAKNIKSFALSLLEVVIFIFWLLLRNFELFCNNWEIERVSGLQLEKIPS